MKMKIMKQGFLATSIALMFIAGSSAFANQPEASSKGQASDPAVSEPASPAAQESAAQGSKAKQAAKPSADQAAPVQLSLTCAEILALANKCFAEAGKQDEFKRLEAFQACIEREAKAPFNVVHAYSNQLKCKGE